MPKGPQITIAICTYNRAGYLKDTLDDLAEQNVGTNEFEILVVNNNSKDGTETVCEIFSKTNPGHNFRYVKEVNQGLSFARNRAAREAQTPVIIYIDDDVKLPQNFVQTALIYIEKRTSTMCAGGRIEVAFDDANPDWIPDELMPMFGLHDLGDEDQFYPQTNFPRGGNMMIRKSIFDVFGYFDTHLGRTGNQLLGSEEKHFFEKLRKNGVEMHYWADLVLTHRIGSNRLEKEYLEEQSIGIGRSERMRLSGSGLAIAKKLGSEVIKFLGSLLLAIGYLAKGKTRAAGFILQFRVWVLKGFLAGGTTKKK
jgi:glycosyltransferase involved in cell wall biosynthesis